MRQAFSSAKADGSGATAPRRGLWYSALALAGAALLAGFPPADVLAQGAGSYLGVASCSGSTCHGRAEGNGAVVRQDEIASWQEPSSPSGAHSRALAVLSGARGRAIAATLGLGNPASAPACLGCHATSVPDANRGTKFLTNDGVGCESCHGPAGGWLAVHYTRSATHATNVGNGLTPLERPRTRANVCLDCHWGSAKGNQFVTHAMMAAGHPRLSFELDLFSTLQQHHQEDPDYVQRKGRTDSVRLWAVGQAEAVRRQTDLFARPEHGSRGVFPELYFFDCHSCHRQITDGPQRKLTFETNPGRPIRFGNPPFNDENMILLSAVARTLAPGEATGFDQASKAFHAAFANGQGEAQKAALALRERASALSGALASRSYPANDAFQVIATVAGEATRPRFTDYAGSVQAVMAVDTLLNALVREGRVTVGAAAAIRASINRAYAAVDAPNAYRPDEFRAALSQAARAVGALR